MYYRPLTIFSLGNLIMKKYEKNEKKTRFPCCTKSKITNRRKNREIKTLIEEKIDTLQ